MQLTPKQREVWIMVELENLPQTEVARRTGRSPESVCRLLSRAKLAIDPLLIAFVGQTLRPAMLPGGNIAAAPQFRIALNEWVHRRSPVSMNPTGVRQLRRSLPGGRPVNPEVGAAVDRLAGPVTGAPTLEVCSPTQCAGRVVRVAPGSVCRAGGPDVQTVAPGH